MNNLTPPVSGQKYGRSLSIRAPITITCRLRVALPDASWMRILTISQSSVRMEVLEQLPIQAHKIVTDVRLHGGDQLELGRLIRSSTGVSQVQYLREGSGSGVYRVTARAPGYLPLFQRLRLISRCPHWVENGIAIWVVSGSRIQIQQLLDGLRTKVPCVQLQGVNSGSSDKDPRGLTPRQWEFLQLAFVQGYFDVPRGVTLTALANHLHISKATLSKTLAIAEGKLMPLAMAVSRRDVDPS